MTLIDFNLELIEHLDFAPVCEWRAPIVNTNCEAAEWMVWQKLPPCGCPTALILLLADDCLQYILNTSQEYHCTYCGTFISADQQRDRIIRMERI